jgi:phage N-6-adenine-methyltransferase
MTTREQLPGIGTHQSAQTISDDWLTPPEILAPLGTFALDPCASSEQPDWTGALAYYTREVNGLEQDWHGRVWLNPPYSKIDVWMRRMAEHNHGIALVFARTETRWFFDSVWRQASAVLFLEGRLVFHRPDGWRARANSGGPSALVAYGEYDAECLSACGIAGALVREWRAG